MDQKGTPHSQKPEEAINNWDIGDQTEHAESQMVVVHQFPGRKNLFWGSDLTWLGVSKDEGLYIYNLADMPSLQHVQSNFSKSD